MRISKGLRQAYELQDFAHAAAMALQASLAQDGALKVAREDAQAVKALVSAWRECQERVSFHRRTPSPGVLRQSAGKKRGTGSGRRPLEPIEIPETVHPEVRQVGG